MDETDDAFNDDTFGGSGASKKPVGKDFDFFGQTAKVSDAIVEEQVRFTRQQPASRVAAPPSSYAQQAPKPNRTGYERYREPDYVPEMQVDANLWGVAPKKSAVGPPAEPSPGYGQAPAGRKMMSLEEVEAAMRAQAKKPAQVHAQPTPPPVQYQQAPLQPVHQHPQHQQQYPGQHGGPQREEQRQAPTGQPIHILQRPQPSSSQSSNGPPSQPSHILQNPNRNSAEQRGPAPGSQHHAQPGHHGPQHPPRGPHGHQSHQSGSRPIITHPHQLANLSEEERAAFLMEDAKRAKRNHKIFLLSKDNGLMTPQDKNFITRIQLQQLVTATGNPNEHGTDAGLAEDFYYQVHNSIQGGPRQHPGQPLSNFAQTYLFQTGGRNGMRNGRHRGGDNHMQRMEQQVQRAVEAAKNKPKNKQLVIEGSLGKISFSNAKTPKPLLNIKRPDLSDTNRTNSGRPKTLSGSDRKTTLTDIENVYDTLMKVEQHAQHIPPPLDADDINPELSGLHDDWLAKANALNQRLWQQLKVHEPIGATTTHPFIAFLSYGKGKKAIPRVFRHITEEQRTTILTMIVVHLDQLDVVRQALVLPGELQPSASIREDIELFSSAVMPPLFTYLNDAGIHIVSGILGLICTINVSLIARTRIGVSMLTMILSRAELIRQAGNFSEQEWQNW